MAKPLKVSIIIPLHVDSPRFYKDLKKFKNLNYSSYEILVVSDKPIKIEDPNVRIIITGEKRTGPAEKRDIAIKKAKGSICAFIDDDAYPDRNWLKNAVIHFSHPQIAAVGGPGLTPKEDGYKEQLTGLVYSSYFCGGAARYRFVKGATRFVDDYPAYNLMVKKSILNKIGGYGTHYYGGEDTFLCLKIVKSGFRIIYDPEVVIFHHRRALFTPYLKQIANIGKHRGYFAKKFPETSFRVFYFLPTVVTTIALIILVLSFFNQLFLYLFLGGLILSVLLVAVSVKKNTSWLNSAIVGLGVIATHLIYGSFFVLGFQTSELNN